MRPRQCVHVRADSRVDVEVVRSPPLPAYRVRHLLSPELLTLYKRLAMGSSHLVYIIMQITPYTIGKALIDYARLVQHDKTENAQDID